MLTLALGAAACKKAASADVAATVNSRPITYSELDKQFAQQLPAGQAQPSTDEATIRKLEVLRALIDAEIMLQRAEKLGLMATDSDVDAKFNEYRAPYTQEDFQRQLSARKMSVDDLRQQIRRNLTLEKLVNKEITSKINVGDKDIAEFYQSNKQSFNVPEPQIHLAQILVTPAKDNEVRNLANNDATTDQQARDKIQMIEQRLRQGEDFDALARNFSEDSATAPNGGDLGFVAQSALDRVNPELRKLLLTMTPGSPSGILQTAEGYRIFKVFARKPAGQRELNDPEVQQVIRDTLLRRKEQMLQSAYYETARNESQVVNYFARSVAQRAP